jgi:hypothetical protein
MNILIAMRNFGYVFFFMSMSSLMDHNVFRDEGRFLDREKFCGVVKNFFDERNITKGAAGSTGRRAVGYYKLDVAYTDTDDSKKFIRLDITPSYINEPLRNQKNVIGRNVCVESISLWKFLLGDFIANIEIDGVNILDSEEVKQHYFREPMQLLYWIAIISIFIIFISRFKLKKGFEMST